MNETNNSVIEGFSLSGDEVLHMTDKHFEIVSEPAYKPVPNAPEKKMLVVSVKLANGIIADWNANKTSQKVIIASRGRNFKDWIGFKGEFNVVPQMVGLVQKQVIYIK